MIYSFLDNTEAKNAFPWILQTGWLGTVCGYYSEGIIQYGSHNQYLDNKGDNFYRMFNRKGGVIVASPGDFYIVSFSSDNIFKIADSFIDFLCSSDSNIRIDKNDLLINEKKVGGMARGQFSGGWYCAWHFSVEQLNKKLIDEYCNKKSLKQPSCFAYEGYDFNKLWKLFLDQTNYLITQWNIDVPSNQSNIIWHEYLPTSVEKTNINSGGDSDGLL